MTTLTVARYERPAPPFTNNRRKKNAYHAALKRDGFRCVRCGSPDDLTMHHKIKVADGGETEADNLETLCATCHVFHHQVEREFAEAVERAERDRGLVAA